MGDTTATCPNTTQINPMFSTVGRLKSTHIVINVIKIKIYWVDLCCKYLTISAASSLEDKI